MEINPFLHRIRYFGLWSLFFILSSHYFIFVVSRAFFFFFFFSIFILPSLPFILHQYLRHLVYCWLTFHKEFKLFGNYVGHVTLRNNVHNLVLPKECIIQLLMIVGWLAQEDQWHKRNWVSLSRSFWTVQYENTVSRNLFMLFKVHGSYVRKYW